MRKALKTIGIWSWILFLLKWAYELLNHLGNLQTLQDIVNNWPAILKYAVLIIGSNWFLPTVGIVCLVLWVVLGRREHYLRLNQKTSPVAATSPEPVQPTHVFYADPPPTQQPDFSDPKWDQFFLRMSLSDWREWLIKGGQLLIEQWTTQLDYPEKYRREHDSKNWLCEAGEFAKKHLTSEQINEFTSSHRMAASPAKKYDFGMALTRAGTQPSSDDGSLAYEIFGKVKLLERFRSAPTEQEEQLSPKLKIICHPNHPGCFQQSPHVQWSRVAVNCHGVNFVEGCRGYISNIRKDGDYRWTGDSATVTFAPGDQEDATNKTINSGKTEFLDIFGVTYEGNMLFVATKERDWQFAPDLRKIFAETGDYFLDVTIANKSGCPTIQAELKFTWTGNWATSFLYTTNLEQI